MFFTSENIIEYKMTKLEYEKNLKIVRLISVLLTEPDEQFSEIVEKLLDLSNDFSTDHNIIKKEINESFLNIGKDLLEFKVEYSRHFIGASNLYTPPYASFYLDSQNKMMTEHTIDTLNMFNLIGLEPLHEDLPDHIVYELELLYQLGIKIQEGDIKNIYSFALKFINDHSLKWMSLYYEALVQKKANKFYICLMKLTLLSINNLKMFLVKD